MEEALAMTILGLKSAGDALVRKLISTALSTPKQILKIIFGIQLKIIYFTFGCLVRIYRVVLNSKIFNKIFPEKVNSPVADQKAVVKGAKKVRRALCLSLEQFYGLDVKSDMALIKERLDEVHRCIDEDDNDKTFEALAKLRELDKKFEEEAWKNDYMKDLEVCEYTDDESETEEKEMETEKPTNILEEPESTKNKVTSSAHKEQDSNSNEIKRVKQGNGTQLQAPETNKNAEKSALKNKLTIANAKLEEILNISSDLIRQVTQLNSQVNRLTSVSNKMASMEKELGEGRKLLSNIETDRNEMKKKLSILERMIQEEEQYLDDISCESGYDEGETHS